MSRPRNIFITLAVAICCQMAIAQTSSSASAPQPFWPQRTSDELAVAPSPEVATLPAWNGPEVDLATGQGRLAFPLLQWSVGGYPVNLGLSYRIGAFRTEELPGWVGLGWNLTGLGSVSRTIMGQPDEKLPLDIRTPSQIDNASDGLQYLTDIEDLKIDASLDRYRYALPSGQGGEFIIKNGVIVQLPQTDNTIERIGGEVENVRDFKITAPDGTQYEFCEREYSEYRYTAEVTDNLFRSPNYRAVTTWFLSTIVTPEGADTIKFEYAATPPLSRNHHAQTISITIRDDGGMGGQTDWLHNSSLNAEGISVNTTFFPQPKILSKIISRTATLQAGFYESDYNKYLSSLTLRNSDGNIVYVVDLSRNNGRTDEKFLKSYTVTSPSGDVIDGCQFSYNSRDIHHVGDFFGYPNASVSAPRDFTTIVSLDTRKFNPRRRYNFSMATAGALTRTLSASGVITDYAYEPNAIPYVKPATPKASSRNLWIGDSLIRPFDPIGPPLITDSIIPGHEQDPDSLIAIGIRLRSITSTDISTGRKIKRQFSYSEGIANIDLSTLGWRDFVSLSGMQWFYFLGTAVLQTAYDTSATLLPGSRMPGVRPEDAAIFYGKATEYISGTGIAAPLRTDYLFDLSRCPLSTAKAGRPMEPPLSNLDSESRSLVPHLFPLYGSDVHRSYFVPLTVNRYWREHIGAAPELKESTRYRWTGTQYLPIEISRRYYSTVDSLCLSASFHSEPLVRRIRKHVYPDKTAFRDYQSTQDLSYFDVMIEATSRQLDSLVTEHHYPDGSTAVVSKSYLYGGHAVISLPGGGLIGGPLPFDPYIPIVSNPDSLTLSTRLNSLWGGDSIRIDNAVRLPYRETVRAGGHTMERHTLYSSMITSGFYKEAALQRGLKTLPVAEMWVMDGCDTLVRRYQHTRYPTRDGLLLTRTSLTTTAINGYVTDRQCITGYSTHGWPTGVEQTGQPPTSYAWGYDGDLLTHILLEPPSLEQTILPRKAISIGSDQLSYGLCTSFGYTPLVGCTRITSPSGKSTAFTYSGNRLSQVLNSSAQVVASYGYELHASGSRNRITSTAHLAPATTAVSTRWFDGFGGEVAMIHEALGTAGQDVAAVTIRDALGRPLSQWLPLPLSQDDIADGLKSEQRLKSAASAIYADPEAVSRIIYDDSHSHLPVSATIGGSAFASHPRISHPTCSNPADPLRRVVRWLWDGASLSARGYYAAGELSAIQTTDPDSSVTIVFTDCLGATVLSRRIAPDGGFADTYTVSDRWGNPLIVIPPELSRQLGSGNVSTAKKALLIEQYAFLFRYDRQMRLRSRKLPGCQPMVYAYDACERLAFTRDGNQAQSGRRSFILYDAYGRPAITGTCSDALSEAHWDSAAMPHTCFRDANTAAGNASTFLSTGYTVSPALASALADARLLSVKYYDDYSFIPAPRQSGFTAHKPASANANPRGLPTGSLTAILADGQSPLLSATFYDSEDRPVATVSDTHIGSSLLTATSYNLGGLPVAVTSKEIGTTGTVKTSTLEYTYGPHGRLISTGHTFGSLPKQPLSTNSFDPLGRISATDICGFFSRTAAFDLHGWPTAWSTPFISQQLRYADGPIPSYTGRISSKITIYGGETRRYDYTYDNLGRLLTAQFAGTDADGSPNPSDFSTSYSYDLHGNLLTLRRYGLIAPHTSDIIDDLTATFNGNQIATLRDDADDVLLEASLDLKSGIYPQGSFDYDPNGNQTRDLSRAVAHVQYNILNLPQNVAIDDGSSIRYIYSADGTKLAEIVCNAAGDTILRRDWVGNFEYKNGAPDRLHLPRAYLTLADTVYHAYIPDYQGNILAVYNTSTQQIEQLTDYYPFGLPLATSSNPTANRAKFSAKDLSTDLGINLYDFAARWHNPAFPHFTTPDPLATNYLPLSPYTFCAADPINFIDPTGTKISLLPLTWSDNSNNETIVSNIISDLCLITGLTFTFDKEQNLSYETHDNGTPVISTISVEGHEIEAGSKTARDLIIKKIKSNEMYEASRNNTPIDTGTDKPKNKIGINPTQIQGFIDGTVGMDNRTLGFGMTFLHELLHTNPIGYDDIKGRLGTGKTVDTMNIIRKELNLKGYDFGKRKNYEALPIRNSKISIIPFDEQSFTNSKDGDPPRNSSKYIIISY